MFRSPNFHEGVFIANKSQFLIGILFVPLENSRKESRQRAAVSIPYRYSICSALQYSDADEEVRILVSIPYRYSICSARSPLRPGTWESGKSQFLIGILFVPLSL